MKDTVLTLDSAEIIHWFNAVRNTPVEQRTRLLDAFWSGQIDSKCWLVNTLNNLVRDESNIYIFGGWVGVLGSLLLQCSRYPIKKLRSVDIDPWCENIADTICKIHEMNDWRFKARTCSMSDYEYEWGIDPHIVINTSCEHVTQIDYDRWYNRIPAGTLVVIQGNNFFSCAEHIRCSESLIEFKQQNHARDILFEGQLPHDMYTRYMCIWRK
jgi:hypothetical protein